MKVKEYIKHQIQLNDSMYEGLKIKHWVDAFLRMLPHNPVIIEIGSGTGRGADYIENKGYKVIRTDKMRGFIEHQEKLGKKVEFLDIKKGVIYKAKADAVFALCVFNLFSISGINDSFRNINSILKEDGHFAFNVTAEWEKKDIENICLLNNFNIEEIIKDSVWYYVICKKQKR